MNTHLQGMSLPADSVLNINTRVTQPLNVTAFSARQRVTQYVMQQLSTQLGGGAPDLTVGERVYWSVPIVFTLPGKGVLGQVGTLRIDAVTAELLTDLRTEIAMPIRGRKAKPPKLAGGTRVLCVGRRSYLTSYRWRDPQGRPATVKVAAVYCSKRAQQQKKPPLRTRARRRRNDVPFELYAYGGWQPKSPQGLRGVYRRRFGIESEYRQVNQARIRTSTRDPIVRLLYVGLALLLRNLWVWLHYAVLSGPRFGGRIFRWGCLRLAQLLTWLWQVAQCYFGVHSLVERERPPPKELRPVA